MSKLIRTRLTRAIALTLCVTVVLPSIPVTARQQAPTPTAEAGPSSAPSSSPATPPPEAPKVAVNRTARTVAPPPGMPVFSDPPTAEEITRARVFEEPLLAIGPIGGAAEHRALAAAIMSYLNAHVADGTGGFETFLQQYPSTPWRASLLTNLGIVWRRTGHFSKAHGAWTTAWNLSYEWTDERGRRVADRALGELVELTARLGRFDLLAQLLDDVKERNIRGSATERVSGARQALWMMENRPEHSFRCGPLALDHVLRASRPGYTTPDPIRLCPSTKRGTSLLQMRELAASVGERMRVARRAPGAPMVLPAMVHWNLGHFAALVEQRGDKILMRDSTFGDELWLTPATLDEEASGYSLIRDQPLPDGWQAVGDEEGGRVWGKGFPYSADPTDLKPPPPPPPPGSPCGMPVMSIHKMLVSLTVQDSPLWYTPPKGPAVSFLLTYNQREAFQPQTFSYSNLGPKWTFDWLSYLEDDPTNPSAAITVYHRGGGLESASGFNTSTNSYAVTVREQALITRTSTSPVRYERQLPNGSVEVFAQPDGVSTFPRKVFLTEWRDPQGNALTFTYDSSLRIIAATDALGQVTTLAYEHADPLKITKIIDPFGRFATFAYDTSGRLQQITDILGLTSAFTYGWGDVVATVITPYGTTTLTWGEVLRVRWAETTDPLGGKERVSYGPWNSGGSAPSPLQGFDDNHRDTLYWDKKAMASAPGDPAAATEFFWAAASNGMNLATAVPLKIKKPLENPVWYNYKGGGGTTEGTVRQPVMIGRVLDSGATQFSKYEYNARGRMTKRTDPLNRETVYEYDTTGLDLLRIKQKNGAGYDLLETRTYNSQHLPLTVTDAAAQTTTLTYNAAGQVLTATNALSETTTNVYDTAGYLTSITGALSGATTTLAYDGYGRPHTVTDSEGYVVTTDYDGGGRVTRVTYPDATYDQIVYNRLDPGQQRDRLGRWTQRTFDAARRLTAVRDPLGRTVTYDWCGCGSLAALVDGNGNRTRWERDGQARVTQEIRPNGAQIAYAYENTTSRLKQVTDPKGQVTTYTYALDDAISQVAYTNAEHATPTVSFTYDSIYGRPATMVDGTGTTTYAYKAIGTLGGTDLASIDGPLSSDVIAYTYDELGRVASRAINSVPASWSYDAMGRATGQTNALGTFGYTFVGASPRLSTVTYPNSQTSTFSYFGHTIDDRLQTILHQRSDTSTLSRFDYTYDALGHIATWTQQADATAAVAYLFKYDSADQLIAATKQTTDATPAILKRYVYRYDPAGNRTSEQIDNAVTGATYDNANRLVSQQPSGGLYFAGSTNEPANVLIAAKLATVTTNTFSGTPAVGSGTSVVTVAATDGSGNTRTNQYEVTLTGTSNTLTYDANGNLTADGTRTFEWDAANRLVTVNNGIKRSEFTYDGESRRTRIFERENGATVRDARLFWDGTRIIEERLSTGEVNRFFADGEQHNGAARYLTRDHLGSVREVTDATGTVITRNDYDPHGRLTRVVGTQDSRFGFTGHYHHAASGLALALYRAYDPALGRWLSEDPARFIDGPNLFSYVGQNPLRYIDPLGLWDWPTAGNGTWSGVVGGTINGAIMGGMVGGVAGAAAGMMIGALAGAAGGMLGGGLESDIGGIGAGAVGGAIGGSVRTGGRLSISGIVGGAAGGALSGAIGSDNPVSGGIAGAVGGAVGGFATGGWTGAGVGAVSGAIAGAANGALNSRNRRPRCDVD